MQIPFIFLLLHQISLGGILYSTDFDDFTVGENEWSANSNWATNNPTGGVNFIDDLAFNQALLKTAGLGFNRPSLDRVVVLTQVPHDHLSNGETIIEIETLIAIKDSSNNFRDDFFFSIFNPSGTRLASIRFDNENPEATGTNFGFWREDGVRQFDTNFDFVHEELYDLFMTIDLSSNTWSASVGGSPLFENATFTSAASDSDISLQAVGYEWDISAPSTFLHGDNFLLIADLNISSKAPNQAPILDLQSHANDSVILSWEGFAGKTYQIEYSDSLSENSWNSDLPDSTFTTTEISTRFQFATAASTAKKFYRVVQSD